jgi:hypothetical protein
MTTRTTLDDGPAIERHFADALTLLRAVRATLADLLRDLLEGGEASLRDLTGKQAELETALKRAFEAEAKWNDWQAKRGEGRPGSDIDLSAVREEIACRLARLRACCEEA